MIQDTLQVVTDPGVSGSVTTLIATLTAAFGAVLTYFLTKNKRPK